MEGYIVLTSRKCWLRDTWIDGCMLEYRRLLLVRWWLFSRLYMKVPCDNASLCSSGWDASFPSYFSQSLFYAWCWEKTEELCPIYNIYCTGERGWIPWKGFSVLAPSSSFPIYRLLLQLYRENCLETWNTLVLNVVKLDCLFVHMKWKMDRICQTLTLAQIVNCFA